MLLTKDFVEQTYHALKTSEDPITGGDLSPAAMAVFLLARLAAELKKEVVEKGFHVYGPSRSFPSNFSSPAPHEENPALAISRRSNERRPSESIHIWVEEKKKAGLPVSHAEQIFRVLTPDNPTGLRLGSIYFMDGACVTSTGLVEGLCAHIDKRLPVLRRNDNTARLNTSGPSLG